MTACPNAHSKRTPFVALRHVHAKLLYGGGMRGCLRVYDGIPAGAAECRRDLAVDSRGEVPTKISAAALSVFATPVFRWFPSFCALRLPASGTPQP